MAEWKNQVQYALDELLKEHDRVLIVAHSMGTLFAIQEAIKKPIAELFLLNVPLKIRARPQLFEMVYKIWQGKINPDDEQLLAAQAAYSIERDRHILRYDSKVFRAVCRDKRNEKDYRKIIGPIPHIFFAARRDGFSEKLRIA